MPDPVLDAIAALRAALDQRVQGAYEHGYQAGIRHAEVERDQAVYRRGYEAGYSAARRGREADPAGARSGRPRLHQSRPLPPATVRSADL